MAIRRMALTCSRKAACTAAGSVGSTSAASRAYVALGETGGGVERPGTPLCTLGCERESVSRCQEGPFPARLSFGWLGCLPGAAPECSCRGVPAGHTAPPGCPSGARVGARSPTAAAAAARAAGPRRTAAAAPPCRSALLCSSSAAAAALPCESRRTAAKSPAAAGTSRNALPIVPEWTPASLLLDLNDFDSRCSSMISLSLRASCRRRSAFMIMPIAHDIPTPRLSAAAAPMPADGTSPP